MFFASAGVLSSLGQLRLGERQSWPSVGPDCRSPSDSGVRRARLT